MTYTTFNEYTHMFGTHIRIDSLMFGVLLAYFYRFTSITRFTSRIPLSALIVSAILLLSPPFFIVLEECKWFVTFGFIQLYIGSGLLLIAALRLNDSASGIIRAFASVGAASYSIYLWHMPVVGWGRTIVLRIAGNTPDEVYVILSVLGSFLVGLLMNRLIEKPVLLLRDQIYPSQPQKHLATEFPTITPHRKSCLNIPNRKSSTRFLDCQLQTSLVHLLKPMALNLQ